MDTNRTPTYDQSDNPTGCCPRFKPQGWNGRDLQFVDKPFARAKTKNIFHIPLDMGPVFRKTYRAIKRADAECGDQSIVLSRELSSWAAEHLFSISKIVPGLDTIRLSGRYRTKVFEGAFKDAPKWEVEFRAELAAQSLEAKKIYLFYTTCPSCAKAYGKNYVVAVADIAPKEVAQ